MSKLFMVSVMLFPVIVFAQFGDIFPGGDPDPHSSYYECIKQFDKSYCTGIFSSEQIAQEKAKEERAKKEMEIFLLKIRTEVEKTKEHPLLNPSTLPIKSLNAADSILMKQREEKLLFESHQREIEKYKNEITNLQNENLKQKKNHEEVMNQSKETFKEVVAQNNRLRNGSLLEVDGQLRKYEEARYKLQQERLKLQEERLKAPKK